MKCIECRYNLSAYQVCKDCNKDSQTEIQTLKSSFEKLLLELNQIKEENRGHLDTLHRRNMQIKELKNIIEKERTIQDKLDLSCRAYKREIESIKKK